MQLAKQQGSRRYYLGRVMHPTWAEKERVRLQFWKEWWEVRCEF